MPKPTPSGPTPITKGRTTVRSPQRILTDQRVVAACALDTVPLLARRVTNLLSWGRRMSVAHRFLTSEALDLKAGLTVDHGQGDRAITFRADDHYASFSVYLTPGLEGFSFAVFASDGNTTEEQVWKRYHSDGRNSEITTVNMIGGGEGNRAPGKEDRITITYWNQRGVGRQTVVGFDSSAYFDAWTARENAGWASGGERLDVEYCKEFALVGPYRVTCGFPIVDGTCSGAADHAGPWPDLVPVGAAV